MSSESGNASPAAEPARPAGLNLDPGLIAHMAAKVPLFRDIPAVQLRGITAMGELCRFTVGECVFSEGELGDAFYVLLTGAVAVEKWSKDRNVMLVKLEPGDCFGEMALLNDEPRSASVRALSNIVALRFRRDAINASAATAAAIYGNFAGILAHRLVQSSNMLAELVTREER